MQRYSLQPLLSSLLQTIYVKLIPPLRQKMLVYLKLYAIGANSAKINTSSSVFLPSAHLQKYIT